MGESTESVTVDGSCSANPGWTVRADIRLDIRKDIRKTKDVRVELSVQPRISTVNFALGYS